MRPLLLRVDYIPERVNLGALKGGKYIELVNLVPWKVCLFALGSKLELIVNIKIDVILLHLSPLFVPLMVVFHIFVFLLGHCIRPGQSDLVNSWTCK